VLVALLNNPQTEDEWNVWSFHHRLSHNAIRAAVLRNRDINLVDYQIDPINQRDMQDFLQRNSQLHIEMNAVLGAQTIDLQETDFSNPNTKQAWVYAHFLEHQTAENKAGIGS